MRRPTATAIETTATIAMMAASRTISLLSSAFRMLLPVMLVRPVANNDGRSVSCEQAWECGRPLQRPPAREIVVSLRACGGGDERLARGDLSQGERDQKGFQVASRVNFK
jgi:hypothetical protein